MRDWRSWFMYEMCHWISMPGFTLAFGLRYEGGRNIPRRGPVLLICNHQSYLDPLLVGVAARRRQLCFLARKSLFRGWFGGLIHRLNAVPVDQEGVAKEGLRSILEQLNAGRAVLVFPEGERTGTGELQPLKPGILVLLKRMAAPIVPVGIAGAFDALPRSRKWPKCSPLFLPATGADIAVSIGKPISAERFADMPREQVLEELTEELKRVAQRRSRCVANPDLPARSASKGVPCWRCELVRDLSQQMRPQFADGLVFLVADAFDGQLQFVRHVLHRPALEAQLQDALLARREHVGSRLTDDLARFAQVAAVLIVPVGHAVDGRRELALRAECVS